MQIEFDILNKKKLYIFQIFNLGLWKDCSIFFYSNDNLFNRSQISNFKSSLLNQLVKWKKKYYF